MTITDTDQAQACLTAAKALTEQAHVEVILWTTYVKTFRFGSYDLSEDEQKCFSTAQWNYASAKSIEQYAIGCVDRCNAGSLTEKDKKALMRCRKEIKAMQKEIMASKKPTA